MWCLWVKPFKLQAVYIQQNTSGTLTLITLMPESDFFFFFIMFDICLPLISLRSFVNNGHPLLPSYFFILRVLWSHSFHLLQHLPVSSHSAHLYSFLSWSVWPENLCPSHIFFAFVSHFLTFPFSHQAQTTCWDHPKMTELYQALGK